MIYPRHYLEFADTTGLDLPRFATFRLRGTWAKRLQRGDTVFLAGLKDRQIIGTAKVITTAAGPALAMLDQHAAWSHIEQGNKQSWQFRADGPVARRFASLTATYGPNRFTETSILSVIYLKRVT